MPDLNVKVGLIGKFDMLKFKNMKKVREKAIQAASADEISGVFPVNENAKALHPDFLELVIDRIIDRGGAQAKTFVLKRADGAPPLLLSLLLSERGAERGIRHHGSLESRRLCGRPPAGGKEAR